MDKHDHQNEMPMINWTGTCNTTVSTLAKFWILSSERELYRPSNTARLLKMINPESTEIFCWERTRNPDQLIKNINSKRTNTYVLFPTETEELENRKVAYQAENGISAFIIIDGTWKEARRIFRKSDFLQNLPIVSLEPDYVSNYDLRRGAVKGTRCTIEAAIEILKMNAEIKTSRIIEDYYKLFLKSYKAGVRETGVKGKKFIDLF